RQLEVRARAAILRFGVSSPRIPTGDGAADYLQFFTELVESLEQIVSGVNTIVEDECRELLSIAATRVFSHLRRLNPRFDFSSVLGPVDPRIAIALDKMVRPHVEALVQAYGRSDEASEGGDSGDSGEDGEEGSGDSEELEDDEDGSGDSASSTQA
ncbi:hypothetical protein JBE27_52325, partial [Streptomyces albiflaviniger]|nr:hypothetical protein [Streptomyces albiflaviniger]